MGHEQSSEMLSTMNSQVVSLPPNPDSKNWGDVVAFQQEGASQSSKENVTTFF